MSRFNGGRWGRIVVWTGAALAWAGATTAAALEPLRAQTDRPEQPPPADVAASSSLPALPTMPARGLAIIRYTPSETPAPEVRTVYVRQTPSGGSSAGAPAASSAPAPTSSGS
ncbi:MAG TPA: hypothetical protein VIC07_09705 [Acidimicrobiia bacterium]|jgi:hypothetical protein